MKKNLSVLSLFVSSSLRILIWLMLALAVVDVGIFAWAATKMQVLERILNTYPFGLVFFFSVLAAAVYLGLIGCEFSAKQGYTLRRLSVTEYGVFLWQAVYNSMCFFLLWGWQTVVLYLLCSIHSACAAPEYASVQTTVLAFYRNDFLHNLMPLADVFRWIRNFLLVLLLGTATAEVPLRQRKGKFAMESVFAVVFAVIGFIYSDRNTVIPEAAIVIVSLVLGAILLLAARRTVKMHEEI